MKIFTKHFIHIFVNVKILLRVWYSDVMTTLCLKLTAIIRKKLKINVYSHVYYRFFMFIVIQHKRSVFFFKDKSVKLISSYHLLTPVGGEHSTVEHLNEILNRK